MSYRFITNWLRRPTLRRASGYLLAVASLGLAFVAARTFLHFHLPLAIMSFSLCAIAITFWYGGTGPGILALLLTVLIRTFLFRPEVDWLSRIAYDFVSVVFSFFMLQATRAKNELESRVAKRTAALTKANEELHLGAGNGELTSLTAERIGPSGRVYSTEMDSKKLAALEQLSAKQPTIIPIKSLDSTSNLPDHSCDSIYMRLVHHHFTKPREMDSSLFRSLKHRGRLAIVDEEPSKGSKIPDGVPKNRGEHGIPEKVLITELKHAGFKVQTVEKDWPGGDSSHQMYCVVFLKR